MYSISKDEALKFLATVLCLKYDIRTPFYDAEICIDTSESEPRLTGFNFKFFERQPPEGVVMEKSTFQVPEDLMTAPAQMGRTTYSYPDFLVEIETGLENAYN